MKTTAFTATGTEIPSARSEPLLGDLRQLKEAIDFYDRVQASTGDERTAVGRDHYDWVFRAARLVVKNLQPDAELTGSKQPEKEQA